jgi:predicted permease
VSWFSRLKNALIPNRLDNDLAEEMADHLERRAVALAATGLTKEEARRAAQARFGNTLLLRETSRDLRLWGGLDRTLQDVRYAWRGIRKGPAFAATVIFSLALAIGANTAIYSIVDAAILRPLPLPHPERLFALGWPGISDPGGPPDQERESFSYPEFLRYREITAPVARLALVSSPNRVEARGPHPNAATEKLNKSFISGTGFDALGVRPARGNLFTAEQDRVPNTRAVAVLSYEYWQRRFGKDPAVVGQIFKIEGKPYEIIGVAQQGFFGVEPGCFVDVWVPGTMYDSKALTDTGYHWFRILGRLRAGAKREQVQARIQPSFHQFQIERVNRFPTIPPVIRKQFLESVIRVHPANAGVSYFRKTFSSPIWIVFGVSGGILLIACANVATLLLARSTARASEMALRVSLGAGRLRLIRQLVTESLLLSLLGGGVGWLLARITAPSLVHFLSEKRDFAVPAQFVLAIDTRVLLFCAAVSTVSALIFGLMPAWQSSGVQPSQSLRSASGQAGKLRLGKVFVSIQVACAMCLVLVGSAFLFSLHNLLTLNPGFDERNVAVFNLTTETDHQSEEKQRTLMVQLQERVAHLPNVQGAALALWPIFQGTGWSEQVIIPGKGPSEQEEIFYRISAGYFKTMQTRFLAGRDFVHADGGSHSPGAAIVNQAFARKYFGRDEVVGQEFAWGREPAHRQLIVGLVADAHYYDLRRSADPIVYFPEEGSAFFTLYARSPMKLGTLARMVEREAQSIGSGMQVKEISSLDTIVGNTLLRERLLAGVGGAFAFFGLMLVAVGLFGLLSYSVSRRTKEIGIRTALGARRAEIIWLVIRELTALLSLGLTAGLATALAVLALLRSLLFGLDRVDPKVIGTSLLVFLLAGTFAATLPAHRAATIDPVSALRDE